MLARAAFCVLVGSGVGLALYALRGFFPAHAFLIGVASAGLAYSVFRAVDNLRSAAREATPRHQDQGDHD